MPIGVPLYFSVISAGKTPNTQLFFGKIYFFCAYNMFMNEKIIIFAND